VTCGDVFSAYICARLRPCSRYRGMIGVAPLAFTAALPVACAIVCRSPVPSLLCGIAAGLVADTSVTSLSGSYSDGGLAQQQFTAAPGAAVAVAGA